MAWEATDTSQAVGAGAQAGGSIASGIMAIIAAMKESQSSKMARKRWESMQKPVGELMSGLYYNPEAEKYAAPYTEAMRYKIQNAENANRMSSNSSTNKFSPQSNPYSQYGGSYNYAPSQQMQALYSNYLNRQYGLSNTVAKSMVAQSMQPVNLSKINGTPSVAGAAKGATGFNAQAFSAAAMGQQSPSALRQQDYLNNAAQLSSFNLWRAKQTGELIG
jgi:hypothetical protein